MRVRETRLQGLLLVEPDVHSDERGFFLETYSPNLAALGISVEFVQDNHSRSVRGTVRGLHYQASPGQAKLVRVARGRIWDVAVDIRKGSPTFGVWEAFVLDDVAHHQLFVPVGFAHGFCVTSPVADVCYKVSSPYDAAQERGLAWNDESLAIPWPTRHPQLSDRDSHNPSLAVLTKSGR